MEKSRLRSAAWVCLSLAVFRHLQLLPSLPLSAERERECTVVTTRIIHPVGSTIPKEAEEAREAFLASQSGFAAVPLPEQVSEEAYSLPFPCVQPIQGGISSGFGYRIHPLSQELRFHYGTDIAADYGESICSFADGTVTESGWDDGYGNYLIVSHAEGYTTLYGHCSSILTQPGQSVSAGQELARVGSSGVSTGPHLHFELRQNGTYLNPEYWMAVL